jgi:predicted nucleotidyltransferase
MRDLKDLEQITSSVVEGAKARYGSKLNRVLLYGSYARGDYDDQSDIDIMILADIEPEKADRIDRELVRLASRLSLDHDVHLSLTLKDSETFDSWSEIVPFYKNVNREGVLL